LDFIAAFFGCLYAGVVAVPAYPPRRNRSLSRIQNIVNDSLAKVALTNAPVLERVQACSTRRPTSKAHLAGHDQLPPAAARLAGARRPWRHAGLFAIHLRFDRHSQGVVLTHAN